MGDLPQVAVFWDFENCAPPSSLSGYELVRRIRDVAHEHGSIKSFKAYTELSEQNSPRSIALRSELQSSGVSIIDCPHNGYKNVADQMMIADMLMFAMDNPHPLTTTILLISGDRDFCYSLSSLRLRMYNVAVIAPPNIHPSLRAQVSTFSEWSSILAGTENASCTAPQRPRSRPRSVDLSSTVASSSSSQIPRKFPHVSGSAESPVPLYGTPISSSAHSRSISHLHDADRGPPGYSATSGGALPGKSSLISNPNLPSAPAPAPQQSKLRYENPSVKPASSSSSSHRAPLPPFPRPRSAEPSLQGVGATTAALPQDVLAAAVARRAAEYNRDYGSIPSDTSPSALPDTPSTALPLSAQPTLHPSVSSSIPSLSDSSLSASGIGDAPFMKWKDSVTGGAMASSVDVVPKTSHIESFRAPLPVSVIADAPTGPTSATSTPGATPTASLSGHALVPPPTSDSNPIPPLIPQYFLPLVQHLEKVRLQGNTRLRRGDVATAMREIDEQMYVRAGCTKFRDFSVKAEKMGLVTMGGRDKMLWIGLRTELYGKVDLDAS